jgi:hypothetical protein
MKKDASIYKGTMSGLGPTVASEEGRYFITMYAHTWGRGRTALESKSRARKEGGRGTEWVTYLLPEGAEEPYVDGMGMVCWTWGKGADRTQKMHEAARGRGVKKPKRSTAIPGIQGR